MDDQQEIPGPGPSPKLGLVILGAAALLVAGVIGWKAWTAAEAEPQVARATAAVPTIEQLQRRVDATPDDATAWQELGFAHFGRGEFTQAATAYAKAASIDGDEAVLWSALGEARVMASVRDPMPEAALAAFRRAAAIDPNDPRARYFLAVKRDLDGDHGGAIEDWLALLADTPPGAPWEEDLVRTISQVGEIHSIETQARLSAALDGRLPLQPKSDSSLGGPTAQQVAAASALPPSEQRQMAEGMVARLEQRLQDDPGNIEGWIMLMRSRMTLGQPAAASQALADAVAANPSAAGSIRTQARALGVQ